MNAFEILNVTGLTISNYYALMALSGCLLRFLFNLVIVLIISQIR